MFQLPDLPYSRDALAPHMSGDALAVHHGKHHAAYVAKLNALLQARAAAPTALEAIVRRAAKDDVALFNQAAQAWNHAFFWNSMTPERLSGPQATLRAAIERGFGSLEAFRARFVEAGVGQFGSGWVWLVSDADGAVSLITTGNAETPIVDVGVTPLLTCDVWEHAYYLDYKNERQRFLEAFIDQLANWDFAGRQYQARGAIDKLWTYPPPQA